MKSTKPLIFCKKLKLKFLLSLLLSFIMIPPIADISAANLYAKKKKPEPVKTVPAAEPDSNYNMGIVTGNGLRVRVKPDRSSKEVVQLQQFTFVEILEESDEPEEIDNMNAKWFKIKSGEKEGWCYGGFLARKFDADKTDSVSLWKTDCSYDKIIIHHKNGNKFFRIDINDPIGGAVPSKSFRYLAVDTGNDSVRTLTIYETAAGKEIFDSSYINTDLTWKGDRLNIKQVSHSGICCALYEEAFFENGFLKKTGRKGKAAIDCVDPDEEDDTCKKFKVK